ncbi:MAG: hypothetical protein ACOC1X_01580 [Promethearchaeota archaeon]
MGKRGRCEKCHWLSSKLRWNPDEEQWQCKSCFEEWQNKMKDGTYRR